MGSVVVILVKDLMIYLIVVFLRPCVSKAKALFSTLCLHTIMKSVVKASIAERLRGAIEASHVEPVDKHIGHRCLIGHLGQERAYISSVSFKFQNELTSLLSNGQKFQYYDLIISIPILSNSTIVYGCLRSSKSFLTLTHHGQVVVVNMSTFSLLIKRPT